MVYSNRFVMCVVLNGKPVSELANGTVQLPFGSEYSLRFHNKNDRRAVVKFFIDGENVSGNGYVINAHDSIEIHRHAAFDSSFKFVSLESGDAIAQGKSGPNHDKVKGTIEARFYLEKERKFIKIEYPNYPKYTRTFDDEIDKSPSPTWHNPTTGPQWTEQKTSGGMSGILRSQSICSLQGMSLSGTDVSYSTQPLIGNVSSTDVGQSAEHILHDGCTVEGGRTGQEFGTVQIDVEDHYTSVSIFLQGYVPTPKARPKGRKTNKDSAIEKLEAENEELRRRLALEEENRRLREALDKAKEDPVGFIDE